MKTFTPKKGFSLILQKEAHSTYISLQLALLCPFPWINTYKSNPSFLIATEYSRNVDIPQFIQPLSIVSIQVFSSFSDSLYIFVCILTNQFFYFYRIKLFNPSLKDAENPYFARQ